MSTTQVVSGPIHGPSSGGGQTARISNLDHVLKIEVRVRAILAEKDMDISFILGIVQGTVLEFEKGFDQEIDLHVCDQSVAKGHAVKVGENFGLRVSSIHSVEDRINALGPAG